MEEKLEGLKKEYLKTETPDYLANYGWLNLQSRLPDQKELVHLPLVYVRRVILAFSILLIIFTVPLTFAQTSKPGQSLYPLKIASDRVTTKITGDYISNIEKRAQEVIETSDNGSSFDEAASQYRKATDNAKNKANLEDEQKKQELKKKLEEQEKKFQEAQNVNQKNQNRLEQVVEQTRQTRGEVKGENDSQKGQQNSNGEDNRGENNNNGKEHSNGNNGD